MQEIFEKMKYCEEDMQKIIGDDFREPGLKII